MTGAVSQALVDLGVRTPTRCGPLVLAPGTPNPKIRVGPYTMRKSSAIGLMVLAILKAHDEDRPFDERDFTELGFVDEQIRELGQVAWAEAVKRNPAIKSYYEVSR